MTASVTPDPAAVPLDLAAVPLDLDAVALDLDVAEKARAKQLAGLPQDPADEVAVLHRESVERVLGEINAAQRRLAEGSYGTCTGCGQPIAPGRLELRPWASTCTACAAR